MEEKSVDCSSELEVVKREHQNSKGDERRRSKRGQELRVPPRRGKRGRPKQRGFQMSVPGDSVCRRQLRYTAENHLAQPSALLILIV